MEDKLYYSNFFMRARSQWCWAPDDRFSHHPSRFFLWPGVAVVGSIGRDIYSSSTLYFCIFHTRVSDGRESRPGHRRRCGEREKQKKIDIFSPWDLLDDFLVGQCETRKKDKRRNCGGRHCVASGIFIERAKSSRKRSRTRRRRGRISFFLLRLLSVRVVISPFRVGVE